MFYVKYIKKTYFQTHHISKVIVLEYIGMSQQDKLYDQQRMQLIYFITGGPFCIPNVKDLWVRYRYKPI